MDNQTNGRQEHKPLDVAALTCRGIEHATTTTVTALKDAGGLTEADAAMAKLALTIARRIDRDAPECYVSLYGNLLRCLSKLGHDNDTTMVCPLAWRERGGIQTK